MAARGLFHPALLFQAELDGGGQLSFHAADDGAALIRQRRDGRRLVPALKGRLRMR